MKTPFDVQPFVGPLPIRFGMSETEIGSLLGSPTAKDVNVLGEPDWSYRIFSLRFGKNGEGVIEVGFVPDADLFFQGVHLFRDPGAFAKVVASGHTMFETSGFIVIPEIGMTFTGFHDDNEADKAVTVFTRGRWDPWKDDFMPFSFRNAV